MAIRPYRTEYYPAETTTPTALHSRLVVIVGEIKRPVIVLFGEANQRASGFSSLIHGNQTVLVSSAAGPASLLLAANAPL